MASPIAASGPADECPELTVPTRLRPYLLTFDAEGKATGVRADRYELWVYRQLRRRLHSGEIYVDDSQQHRHLSAELVSADQQSSAFEQMDIPWVRRPLAERLADLTTELHTQWLAFDRELRAGELAHLDYDEASATMTCRRPKAEDDEQQDAFYEQLPFCDVADVLRFVNQECQFLSSLTPLQPRYAKQVADENSLLAVIAAQAMNHGNLLMSRTSDIPYHVLEATYQRTCAWPRCRRPTTASAMRFPSCRSSRTTRSTWKRCTPVSTARSSASSDPP